MEARFSRVEQRIGQLEASLGTALQALTNVLQAREWEAHGRHRKDGLGNAIAAGTATTAAAVASYRSHSASDVEQIRRDHLRLAARVKTLEGYVASLLSYIEDQQQRQSYGRGWEESPTAHRIQDESPGQSPVLQARVEHTHAATPASKGNESVASDHDGIAGGYVRSGKHGEIPLSRDDVSRLVDERIGQVFSTIHSERSKLLAELRSTALAAAEAMHQQDREGERLERCRELAAFRASMISELVQRVEDVARKPSTPPADVVGGYRSRGASTKMHDDEERGQREEHDRAKDKTDTSNNGSKAAMEDLVRVAVAEEMARQKALLSNTSTAAPMIEQEEIKQLERRIRRMESTHASVDPRRLEERLASAAEVAEKQFQQLDKQQRLLEMELRRVQEGLDACDERTRESTRAVLEVRSNKPSVSQDNGEDNKPALEGEQLDASSQSNIAQTLELSRLAQNLRREFTTILENKARQLALDVTAAQDAAAVAQEATLLTLREDQASLRDAVRALVTPSVVLQGLDQRLRTLREEITGLQKQAQQQQQQQVVGASGTALLHTEDFHRSRSRENRLQHDSDAGTAFHFVDVATHVSPRGGGSMHSAKDHSESTGSSSRNKSVWTAPPLLAKASRSEPVSPSSLSRTKKACHPDVVNSREESIEPALVSLYQSDTAFPMSKAQWPPVSPVTSSASASVTELSVVDTPGGVNERIDRTGWEGWGRPVPHHRRGRSTHSMYPLRSMEDEKNRGFVQHSTQPLYAEMASRTQPRLYAAPSRHDPQPPLTMAPSPSASRSLSLEDALRGGR